MFKCPVGNCRLGDAASKRCVGSAGGWEHPQEKGVIKVKCGCGVTERTGGKSEEKRGEKKGFHCFRTKTKNAGWSCSKWRHSSGNMGLWRNPW